jgi:hypothetical protein
MPLRPPERLLDRAAAGAGRRGNGRIGSKGSALSVYRRHRLDPIEFHLS